MYFGFFYGKFLRMCLFFKGNMRICFNNFWIVFVYKELKVVLKVNLIVLFIIL